MQLILPPKKVASQTNSKLRTENSENMLNLSWVIMTLVSCSTYQTHFRCFQVSHEDLVWNSLAKLDIKILNDSRLVESNLIPFIST